MPAPPAPAPETAADLAEELARHRVLSAERLAELTPEFPGGTSTEFAAFLVGRGAITSFQAGRVLAGEGRLLALGPYRLVGVHRPGVLGPVFVAEKPGRGPGTFALRAVPLRSLWQVRQARQLTRALAALPSHPVIVPLADVDSANGFHYLVWPLVEGEHLADRVTTGGPLPPGAVAALVAHLASGLAGCHDRQVVHGLLTPHAVALAPRPGGIPRLLDLGAGALLAQNLAADESLFDSLSSARAVTGAIEYAAPEWVADPTNPTPATDQFSLGAVACFALTGRPPVTDLGELLDGPPPVAKAIPGLHPALAAALDRMLQPEPADRFGGLDEVQRVFEELAEDPALAAAAAPGSGAVPPAGLVESPSGGSVSWDGGPPARPPQRDESDESIRFDLPDLPPEPPAAPQAATDTPRQAARPTAATTHPPPAPNPPKPRPPGSPDKKKGFTRPPLLPAAPLVYGAPVAPPTPPTGTPSPVGADPGLPPPPDPTAADLKDQESALWKRVKRKVLFWQAPTDPIRVGVFGPAAVAHSEAPRLTVFLYTAGAAESVATLARAFQHDAVLLGTGVLAQPPARNAKLAIHVAVAHAAVTTPLSTFAWQDQPHRLTFDLVVPWEAPGGPAAGVVSVGQDDVRIGKVEFKLHIRPRKG